MERPTRRIQIFSRYVLPDTRNNRPEGFLPGGQLIRRYEEFQTRKKPHLRVDFEEPMTWH